VEGATLERRSQDPWSLAGRVAIVTGSTSGIGAAIAHELAAAGAQVVVNGRSPERARPVADAIAAAGGRAVAIAADLSTPAGATELVTRTVKELGAVDVLVNNAGMGSVAPSEELEVEEFRRVLELNLVAPFACAQAAGRHMLAAGRGVIVNISSLFGVLGMPQRAAYSSAKHGLIGLTRTLGVEWAGRGVRCVAVDPGYIDTELMRGNMRRGGFSAADLERRTPAGRLGTPEEIARAVRFLACDAAAFVTGTDLLVDGGWAAYGGW